MNQLMTFNTNYNAVMFLCLGTGHADSTRWEWGSNIHRDTLASYIGHFDMLNHIALCENESKARVKFQLLKKMIQPCGPPHEKMEEN